MALAPHVNGPCLITLGLGSLGYCDNDGIEVKEKIYQEDLKSDRLGPNLPVDVINLGTEVYLTFAMAEYDSAIMASFLAMGTYQASSSTRGQIGSLGALRVGGSFTTTLKTGSPIDTEFYNFTTAFPHEEFSTKLFTGQKMYFLTVRCIPNSSGVVYTITNS